MVSNENGKKKLVRRKSNVFKGVVLSLLEKPKQRFKKFYITWGCSQLRYLSLNPISPLT